jgi:hypothetical protein
MSAERITPEELRGWANVKEATRDDMALTITCLRRAADTIEALERDVAALRRLNLEQAVRLKRMADKYPDEMLPHMIRDPDTEWRKG